MFYNHIFYIHILYFNKIEKNMYYKYLL